MQTDFTKFYNPENHHLSFSGELDIKVVEKLSNKRNSLKDYIMQHAKEEVILDFQSLEIVDTSGLAFILSLKHSLEAQGVKVSLINTSVLTSLTKLYNLEEILKIA